MALFRSDKCLCISDVVQPFEHVERISAMEHAANNHIVMIGVLGTVCVPSIECQFLRFHFPTLLRDARVFWTVDGRFYGAASSPFLVLPSLLGRRPFDTLFQVLVSTSPGCISWGRQNRPGVSGSS